LKFGIEEEFIVERAGSKQDVEKEPFLKQSR
jgi:hypothetical protein